MGQRSEIYVGFETRDGKRRIAGRYFQWNYADRMISRVYHTARWLSNRVKYDILMDDLVSIIETNFDMIDHQKSCDLVNTRGAEAVIRPDSDDWLDDGRAFIFVSTDGQIKYGFTGKDLNPLDADGYMTFDTECCYPQYQWTNEEYRNSEKMRRCREQIEWLSNNASLMTKDELDRFIGYSYEAEARTI